ncbi:MYPU_1760 family metalloprotease [Mycoplasma sp. 2634B]|uniref:MYPU_1760 family metalloprotease n=1 Tax=Mycoplasma sp. 2634B TaxID=3401692 RepID=UPI003AB0E401
MSKKRKIIGWSLFSAGVILGLGAIVSSAYFAIQYMMENDKEDQKEIIDIKPEYNVPSWQKKPELVAIAKNEVQFYNKLTNEEEVQALELVNKVGNISWDVKTNDEGTYIEYVDPYTQIKFRDFAYKVDKENPANNRYLLGPGGLAYLANEFKRKVTFGPEVYDLEAININDFTIIPTTANGLYIPSTKNIYINAAFMCETNATLYDRVATIMQTLFHEYMHHWANNYAEIALPKLDKTIPTGNVNGPMANKNQKQMVTVKYYEPGESNKNGLLDKIFSSANEQYWNGYFADYFRYFLNYDVAAKSYIKPEILALLRERWVGSNATDVSDSLYANFSPKDLWDVSNGIYNGQKSPRDPLALQNRLDSKDGFWYSPDEKFALSSKDLRYYYSLTELVPREYLKFAFESYYNINEMNPALKAEAEKQEFSSGYFGNMKFHYSNKASTYEIRPSSIAEDYGKVFMNNFDSLSRSGWYINDDSGIIDPLHPIKYWDPKQNKWVSTIIQGSSSIMIPASPFALSSYKTLNDIPNNQANKIHQDNSTNFYAMFLETMGYGNEIAQIYYDNSDWKWVGKNHAQVQKNETNITKVKFSGYLKDKSHTGIAIVDNNGQVVAHSEIIYLDTFNFFGHKDFDKGARIENEIQANDQLRQVQIGNRIHANRNYISYITKDFIVAGNNGTIYFWDDLNNDGLLQDNEVVRDHAPSVPSNRWVTTYRAENASYYYAVENKNNQTTIHWESPR